MCKNPSHIQRRVQTYSERKNARIGAKFCKPTTTKPFFKFCLKNDFEDVPDPIDLLSMYHNLLQSLPANVFLQNTAQIENYRLENSRLEQKIIELSNNLAQYKVDLAEAKASLSNNTFASSLTSDVSPPAFYLAPIICSVCPLRFPAKFLP